MKTLLRLAVCSIGCSVAATSATDAAVTDIQTTTSGSNILLDAFTVERNGGSIPYFTAETIGVDLVGFDGATAAVILVPDGAAGPAAGSRATLIEDRALTTGLTNFSIDDRALAVQFASPVVNSIGPDVVLFTVSNSGAAEPVRVLSSQGLFSAHYGSDAYNRVGAGAAPHDEFVDVNLDVYSTIDNGSFVPPRTLAQLETFDITKTGDAGGVQLYALPIDLDDFGVRPGVSVTEMIFQAGDPNNRVDLVFIAGLPYVPEPAGLAVLGLAGLALARRRPRGIVQINPVTAATLPPGSILQESLAMRGFCAVVSLVGVAAFSSTAAAQVSLWAQDLEGFQAAAPGASVSHHFDAIPAGTDITGQTLNGVRFDGPGAPLIVVRADETYPSGAGTPGVHQLFATTPENVLSPGGAELAFEGPALENDDLTLTFLTPLSAFGLDFLWQSADGASFTNITAYGQSGGVLFSGAVPASASAQAGGGSDFWGITSAADPIAKIVVDEMDGGHANPDSNIGFDTLRMQSVPEPAGLAAIAVAGTGLLLRRRGRAGSRRAL